MKEWQRAFDERENDRPREIQGEEKEKGREETEREDSD